MKTKILMLVLTCLLLDVISFQAQADSISLGAWSKHINPGPEVNNETHELIAIEYHGYAVWHFKNSFSRETFAVAKYYDLFEKGYFKGGLYVGMTYGYRGACDKAGGHLSDPKVFCPMVVPEITYTKYKTQITVGLMVNAIAIGPKWEF